MSYSKKQHPNPSRPSTLKDMAKIDEWVNLPNGGKLFLLPIKQDDRSIIESRIELQFINSDDYVEPPYYQSVEPTENDPGERVLWDEKSLKKSGTDEDKAWMIRYQKSQAILSEQVSQANSFVTFVDGTYKYISPNDKEFNILIDDDDPAFNAPKGWLMKQKRLGFDYNDLDPYELKYAFVSSLVPDYETMQIVFSRTLELSMRGALTPEALNDFRLDVQYNMVQNAKRIEEAFAGNKETIEVENKSDGILVNKPQIHGSEGSNQDGYTAESVGYYVTE